MSTKSFYHDLIIDHYQHPRNFGQLKNPDAAAREANATCGDMVEFQIKIRKGRLKSAKISNHQIVDKSDKSDSDQTDLSIIRFQPIQPISAEISEIAWRGVGCAISTAAASLLSEKVKQIRQISQISQISQMKMIEMLGGDISHARIKCATLPLAALKAAVAKLDY